MNDEPSTHEGEAMLRLLPQPPGVACGRHVTSPLVLLPIGLALAAWMCRHRVSLYYAGSAAGRPAWRWRGLAIGIAAGVLFSIVRVAQGAQFTSATLWSAAVDWTVCATLFFPLLCRPKTSVR
jgi:membrane-associated PAP2 superfamily phosphatase